VGESWVNPLRDEASLKRSGKNQPESDICGQEKHS